MGSFSGKEDARRGRLEYRAAAFGWYPLVIEAVDGSGDPLQCKKHDAVRLNMDGATTSGPSQGILRVPQGIGLLEHLRTDTRAPMARRLTTLSSYAAGVDSPENATCSPIVTLDFSYPRLLSHVASTPSTTTSIVRTVRGAASSWWRRRPHDHVPHFPPSLTYTWRPVECILAPSDMDVLAMLAVSDDSELSARLNGSTARVYGVITPDPHGCMSGEGGLRQNALAVADRVYHSIHSGQQRAGGATQHGVKRGLSVAGHREVGPVHLARLLRGGDALVIPPHVLFRNLQVLNLSGTSIGDAGVHILSTLMFHSHTPSSSLSMLSLPERIQRQYPVKELILSDCGISDKGCITLVGALMCCLEELLDPSQDDDDDAAVAGRESESTLKNGGTLVELPTSAFLLSRLSLAHNHLTDTSCLLLGQLIAHPTGVEALDLQGNHFGDDGVVEVVAGIRPRINAAAELQCFDTPIARDYAHRRQPSVARASSPVDTIARLRRTVSVVANDDPGNTVGRRGGSRGGGSPQTKAVSCSPILRRGCAPRQQRQLQCLTENRRDGFSLQLSACAQTAAASSFFAETLLAAHDERVLGVLADMEALQQRIQAADYALNIAPTSARSQRRQQQQQQSQNSTPHVVVELLESLTKLSSSPSTSIPCYLAMYTHGLRVLRLSDVPLGDRGVELLCGAMLRMATSAAAIADQLVSVAKHARTILDEELAITSAAAPCESSCSRSSPMTFTSSLVFLEELDVSNANLSGAACYMLAASLFSRCSMPLCDSRHSHHRYFDTVTSDAMQLPIQPVCAGCTQPHLRTLRLGRNRHLGGGGGDACGELLAAFTKHACLGWSGALEWWTTTSTDPFSLGERGMRGVGAPSLTEFDLARKRCPSGQSMNQGHNVASYMLDMNGCGLRDDALARWSQRTACTGVVEHVDAVMSSSNTPRMLRSLFPNDHSPLVVGSHMPILTLACVSLMGNECSHAMIVETRNFFYDLQQRCKYSALIGYHDSPDLVKPGTTESIAAHAAVFQVIDCTVRGNHVTMRDDEDAATRHRAAASTDLLSLSSWSAVLEACPAALLVPSNNCPHSAPVVPPSSPQPVVLKSVPVNPLPVGHCSVAVTQRRSPMPLQRSDEQQASHACDSDSCDNLAPIDMTDDGVDALIRASEEVMLRWDV